MTSGFFHLTQGPQFFSIRFQPRLHFSPRKSFVTVHVFLEAGFQRSEDLFKLFGGEC